MYLAPKELSLLLILLTATTTYSASCSKTLHARTGNIALPPNTQNCEWRIIAGPDEKINLNITNLQNEKQPQCAYSYVEIRDGLFSNAPLLGKFCGRGPVEPIISSGREMLIRFVNTRNYGYNNFTASYHAICGGILYVEGTTNLTYPGNSSLYSNDKRCVWWIMVPEEYTAAITFNTFDIEYHGSCLYDYLNIRDGLTVNSRLLGRYCNGRRPYQVSSSSNKLLLEFASDSTINGRGFAATIVAEIDECRTGRHNCTQTCINTIGSFRCSCITGYELLPNGRDCGAVCGGTLSTPTGNFASPWYPQVYPPNKNCTWEIIPPYHHSVVITYNHFDIEGTTPGNCPKDKLQIYISSSTDTLIPSKDSCAYTNSTERDNFVLLDTKCGVVVPTPITYRASKIRVVFTSDGTIQRSGFSASYYSTLDGCSINNGNCQTCSNSTGRTECYCDPRKNMTSLSNGQGCYDGDCRYEVRGSSGTFSSPNYPNAYPQNKNCEWNFTTTPGHRLNVTFSTFQLERREGGQAYDHVAFTNVYPLSPTTKLVLYNSEVLPQPVISLDNKLKMIFASDGYNMGTWIGFHGSYRSICGGNFTATATKQYIYSHVDFGYANYDNYVLCEWNIVAPAGKSVSLAFLDFELENCGSCGCDWVEMYSQNNSTTIGYGIGKFCNQNKPSPICSVGNNILIRFRTDVSVVKRGFSLVYKAID